MKKIVAKIVSVHSGSNDDLSKEEHASIQVELDGIVGDRHCSYVRDTYKVDKQPHGTVRRNERQWSAVSVEELASISAERAAVVGGVGRGTGQHFDRDEPAGRNHCSKRRGKSLHRRHPCTVAPAPSVQIFVSKASLNYPGCPKAHYCSFHRARN